MRQHIERSRRRFLTLAAAVLTRQHAMFSEAPPMQNASMMYGRIGKITAVSGQRDALAAILLESTRRMPGCLSYVVATDASDVDALWVTEVWDTRASHAASLKLPEVREAIAKGRPMIAGFSNAVETTPLGGVGLTSDASSNR